VSGAFRPARDAEDGMAFLIIDGHGQTDAGIAFDFRRPSPTKCTLYSYTREGVDIGVARSNRIIQAAVLANVVDGWVQRNDSRIGGTFITDRILAAKDMVAVPPPPHEQWVTPIPAGAAHVQVRVGANSVPLECYYVPAGAVLAAATVVVYITSGDPRTLRLSEILNYFNAMPYTVIWAPCRGY
jgi:hypothetical protein